MCLQRKKKGKSKALSDRFCLRDLEAEQRALQFLHIHCSNVNNTPPQLVSQETRSARQKYGFTLFFRYKDITSLKNVPSPALIEFAVLVSGQLCGYVCFELLVERTSFVCIC